MLARQFRIVKKEDFEAVYRQGKKFSLGFMVIMARSNGLQFSRFGVVASAKFSKKAVDRNRIKRQIREIIRKNWHKTVIGKDIVIIVRKINSKTRYTSGEIEDVLEKIFRQAGLINEKKN